MNVAVFSECYHPTRNGVVVSIDTFAEGLRRRGHRVDVFAPRFPGYRVTLPHAHRFPSARLPHVQDYPVALPYWPQVYREFDRLRAEVVHAQSIFVMSRLGAYLARRNNLPLVGTYHTLVAEYSHYVPLPSVVTKAAVVRLSRQFCNACDVVIVPTPSVEPVLRGYGVRAPVVALPTGIEPAEFDGGKGELVRRRHGLSQRAKVLLFVGRVAREKNVDFLLRVLARLVESDPEIRLLMVGPGPYRALAAAYARGLGLGGHLVLAGSQPREELRHYYAAADVFVFPSLTDTQGLVLVEAMAAGLPCVAARGPGACDVLQNDRQGLLVSPEEAEFAAAVVVILTDPERNRRYREAARVRAGQFSCSASAEQLERLYREVVDSRRVRRRALAPGSL
jgi:glycosyltransferase involved in cell wall biosynthesis